MHSNWICRYFTTLKISGYCNKFTFASFQGKSHDKEVKLTEKNKLAKMTKVLEDEEKIEGIVEEKRISEVY